MTTLHGNDDTGLLVFIVVMAVLIGGLVAFGLSGRDTYKRQYLTQRICDRSHAVNDRALEQACGDAQDKYGTEYMCQNLTPASFCWTEVK